MSVTKTQEEKARLSHLMTNSENAVVRLLILGNIYAAADQTEVAQEMADLAGDISLLLGYLNDFRDRESIRAYGKTLAEIAQAHLKQRSDQIEALIESETETLQ